MEDYYGQRKKKLLAQHDSMIKAALPILNERYGDVTAKQLVRDFREEFEGIIPHIPYVGGDENRMTDTFTKITSPLAMYRVLKARGEDVASIGEIVYQTAEAWVQQYPSLMRRLLGMYFASGFSRRKMQRDAQRSQQTNYAEDFVYEVVEGDGETFDWGINYHQCGIIKFFARMDAQEFAPYMCRLDWVMYAALHLDLARTQTIAQGASHCDFHFGFKA